MGVGAVLLALLGVFTLWLAVDAGRERHRLRARMQRSRDVRVPEGRHRPREIGQPAAADLRRRLDVEARRYWRATRRAADDSLVGSRR